MIYVSASQQKCLRLQKNLAQFISAFIGGQAQDRGFGRRVGQQGGGTTTLTVNGPVDATAGLTVAYATLVGATVSAGTTVRSDEGILRGATVNGTIALSDSSGTGHHLTVTNGLTLNGTLLLDSNFSSVSLLGAQTLGGTGTIHFGNVTGSVPSALLNRSAL